MEVHLTPDQEAFIRLAIETGRFRRQEDAVEEAMSLWQERQRPAFALRSIGRHEVVRMNSNHS